MTVSDAQKRANAKFEREVEIEELEISEVLNEYVRWMCNPDNLYNCEECPENHGFSRWPETRKPCGQFRCWVAIHCKVED